MSVEVLFVVARDAYLYWGSAISIGLLLNRMIDKAKQMIDKTLIFALSFCHLKVRDVLL